VFKRAALSERGIAVTERQGNHPREQRALKVKNAVLVTFEKLLGITGILGGIAILAMMVLTTFDVIVRYPGIWTIPGVTEIVLHMMVVAGTLGLGWCALQEAHVNVDLIAARLPKLGQKILATACYFLVLVISNIIVWQALVKANSCKNLGIGSTVLAIPRWPFVVVMAFGYLMLALASFILIVKLYSGDRDK
jgi:TRAP-type C4-dicarboxylate transport system permease small subunit